MYLIAPQVMQLRYTNIVNKDLKKKTGQTNTITWEICSHVKYIYPI